MGIAYLFAFLFQFRFDSVGWAWDWTMTMPTNSNVVSCERVSCSWVKRIWPKSEMLQRCTPFSLACRSAYSSACTGVVWVDVLAVVSCGSTGVLVTMIVYYYCYRVLVHVCHTVHVSIASPTTNPGEHNIVRQY